MHAPTDRALGAFARELEPRPAELALDRCAGPTVGSRRVGAYFVCGFAGYLAGLVLTALLGARAELAPAARLIVAVVPAASLLLAVQLSKLVFGVERIVFYEKAVLAVGASALAAWLAALPVAEVVDLVTLGVGTFLAFGRIGCFRVACCHGRRARHGVAYRAEHADAGFPLRWVGLRVAPVQLYDAALSALMVGAGVWLLLRGAAAGTAACAYVAGYGLGRTALELVRGDSDRPIAGGVTEAQWSALLTSATAAALRPEPCSLAAAAVIAATVLVLAIARRLGAFDRLWLAGAWHVDELAALVSQLAAGAPAATTREGLCVSGAALPDGRFDVVVSRPGRSLALPTLRALAEQLGRPWTGVEVIAGSVPGVFHIVLGAAAVNLITPFRDRASQ